MRRIALALALLVAIPSCREGFFDPTPHGSGEPVTAVEIVGRNVRMLAGESNAIRVSFRPKDPSARLRIERSSSSGRVVACALRAIDDPIPPVERCLPDVPAGVRENLTTSALGALALVREGDPIMIEFRIGYEEGGRSVAIRFPDVQRPPGAPACKDNACNPVFELQPVRGGSFSGTARWEGGDAKLELLEGRVLARELSSTGIPYRIAATRSGPSPLSIDARLNAPSEYALTVTNIGTADLRAIEIDASWP